MRRLLPLGVALWPVIAGAAPPVESSPAPEPAASCPPGDWFCEPTAESQQSPPALEPAEPVAAQALPDAEPAAEVQIDVENVRPFKPRRRLRYREWGVGLHASAALLGGDDEKADGAGMNGFGAAVRFRPTRHFGLEGSLELAFGTDYNGFDRIENALLVSALGVVNPRHAVQWYGLGGIGFGAAYVEESTRVESPAAARDETYSYVGLHAGFGVEARITKNFVLGFDLIGFVRGRTDDDARRDPEFIHPRTRESTNTSGGGLLRGGAFFYF
jgi:hypothetical protein